MDPKGRDKAAYRLMMKDAASKKEKRIDSPLVSYNDVGQPVCKICNVSLKSEALWNPHIVGKLHKKDVAVEMQAVEMLKQKAGQKLATSKSGGSSAAPVDNVPENRTQAPGSTRSASTLPADFFDEPKAKKTAADASPPIVKGKMGPPPNRRLDPEGHHAAELRSGKAGEGAAAPSSALPAGFYDNKTADNKARGVQDPKEILKDEMTEFQKVMAEELEVVDTRQAEEDDWVQAEAAEEREQLENIIQRSIQDRVEALRRKKEDAATKRSLDAVMVDKKPRDDGNNAESDDNSDEDEEVDLLDWRAKQLHK